MHCDTGRDACERAGMMRTKFNNVGFVKGHPNSDAPGVGGSGAGLVGRWTNGLEGSDLPIKEQTRQHCGSVSIALIRTFGRRSGASAVRVCRWASHPQGWARWGLAEAGRVAVAHESIRARRPFLMRCCDEIVLDLGWSL